MLIWDLPVRLTHWGMAALFFMSWLTHELNAVEWHMRSGYAMLTLVLFRLIWGFVGSTTARFSQFLEKPGRVWSYRSQWFSSSRQELAGHSPFAGWSVLVMLVMLLTQCCLGLLSTDLDGYYSGALSYLVSFDTSRMLAQLHELNFDLLAVVIGLHLAAIAWYGLRKRQNLVWPMVTGLASVLSDEASRLKHAPIIRAIVGLAVSGLLVAIIVFSSRF
jgi:cytochrome b